MIALLYLLIFLILLTAAYGAYSAAPWLPTRKADVIRMAELADIKSGERVYDLGCGDGRLVFAAAKKGAEAIGVEIFILPYLYASIKSLFKKRTKILYGDFFNYDLSGADAVFVFLQKKSYGRLAEKFKRELKPGARIVTSCWPILELENKLVKEDKPAKENLPLYLYKI